MMRSTTATTGCFLLLVGLYAAGEAYRMPSTAFSVALPAIFLAIACAIFGRKERSERFWIAAALLLSGIGDLMGGIGRFIAQIAFFALAHATYIAAFARGIEWRPAPRLATIPLVIIAAALLAARILPHIADPVEKSAVAAYMAVITLMASAAGAREWSYAAAAALFMLSDSLIAWNKYVCRIPHATLWIMSTYYAAQLAFALLCMRREPKNGDHLRRAV